jgi:hypothetical protein
MRQAENVLFVGNEHKISGGTPPTERGIWEYSIKIDLTEICFKI